jgi:hypothetical protein
MLRGGEGTSCACDRVWSTGGTSVCGRDSIGLPNQDDESVADGLIEQHLDGVLAHAERAGKLCTRRASLCERYGLENTIHRSLPMVKTSEASNHATANWQHRAPYAHRRPRRRRCSPRVATHGV